MYELTTFHGKDERSGVGECIEVPVEFEKKMERLSTADHQVGPTGAFHQLIVESAVILAVLISQNIHREDFERHTSVI